MTVAALAEGLESNRTYHYRLAAKNAKGESESVDEAFTTPPEAPLATATPDNPNRGGYLLNGTVNPNGEQTKYFFEYGSQAFGLKSSEWQSAGAGSAPVAVFAAIGRPPPGTAFQYRLIAVSPGGETRSNEVFFTVPGEAKSGGSPGRALSVRSIFVKGARASIEVSVPSPGAISASGRDIRGASSARSAPAPSG